MDEIRNARSAKSVRHVAVLVDSSVWIAGAKPKNPECLQLKRLIAQRENLYITRLIQVEVTQGARTETEFHRLWESFLGFPSLEVTELNLGKSASNYFRAKKKGITLTTLDCVIATLAVEANMSLWTLDPIFVRLAPIIGLELYHEPHPL